MQCKSFVWEGIPGSASREEGSKAGKGEAELSRHVSRWLSLWTTRAPARRGALGNSREHCPEVIPVPHRPSRRAASGGCSAFPTRRSCSRGGGQPSRLTSSPGCRCVQRTSGRGGASVYPGALYVNPTPGPRLVFCWI